MIGLNSTVNYIYSIFSYQQGLLTFTNRNIVLNVRMIVVTCDTVQCSVHGYTRNVVTYRITVVDEEAHCIK